MKRLGNKVFIATALILATLPLSGQEQSTAPAASPSAAPDATAVARARKTALMLDDIYKKTIVMITDKYVHDTDDFAAGSAAVLLFKQISESGTHKVRLLDATGMPYESGNVAQDGFEKEAIERLKQGAASHEQVAQADGRPVLRYVSPVPVVMERCIMCHDHYADAKPGEPVGAISYSIPIE